MHTLAQLAYVVAGADGVILMTSLVVGAVVTIVVVVVVVVVSLATGERNDSPVGVRTEILTSVHLCEVWIGRARLDFLVVIINVISLLSF